MPKLTIIDLISPWRYWPKIMTFTHNRDTHSPDLPCKLRFSSFYRSWELAPGPPSTGRRLATLSCACSMYSPDIRRLFLKKAQERALVRPFHVTKKPVSVTLLPIISKIRKPNDKTMRIRVAVFSNDNSRSWRFPRRKRVTLRSCISCQMDTK